LLKKDVSSDTLTDIAKEECVQYWSNF